MKAAVLVALSVFAAAGTLVAQVPPPPPPPMGQPIRDPGRRPPPDPVGTAVIRGRVVSADTGNPIRRATVMIMMTAPAPAPATAAGAASTAAPGAPQTRTAVNGIATSTTAPQGPFARPRNLTTDAQGAFEARGLPAGTYRVTAMPPQYAAGYLGMAFGAKRPAGPGSSDIGMPIQVADGQIFDRATVALPRGAVITGRVTDENGDALARVQVYSIMYVPGSSRGQRNGSGAQTDDLGQFRLFGLVPGDYVIVAEARGNTFAPPNAPPESEEDKIGLMTSFYPGTADEASAQRVQARTGTETPGVEIRMVTGRLFHLSGMVTDSQGRASGRTSGTLFKRGPGNSFTSNFGFGTDEQGRFQLRNIPPGSYRLSVRQQPQGPRGPDGSMPELGEFANVQLSINADVDDILITTSPGATITGNIVFESGPPQSQGTTPLQLRVSGSPADPDGMMGVPTPPPAMVSPDLTFTMKGMSGEMLLRSAAPGNYLKAVLLGAEDITDTPHQFKTGDRVTMVMTSRVGTVEGNVTDAAGKPADDAMLVMFSDEKSTWRTQSIRTRRAGVDQITGHYRVVGLLPGRYYVIAVPRERVNAISIGGDPSVFEALAKEATTVVIAEDEQRQVDLRVVGGGY